MLVFMQLHKTVGLLLRINGKTFSAIGFLLTAFILLSSSLKPIYADSLKATNFTSSELKGLAGHYSTIVGYVHVRVNGQKVHTRIKGKTIILTKKNNGRIYPTYKLLGLFPIKLGDVSFATKNNKNKHQVIMFSKKKGKKESRMIAGEKFTPLAIPNVWKARLGSYKAKILTGKSGIKKIRLAIQNGVLVAFINKLKTPYPLLAKSNADLTSPSAGHNNDQPIKVTAVKKVLQLRYGSNSLVLTKI